MKELSVEEKAKAYDEAIERANELLCVSDKESLQRKTIESVLPELKESGDERIMGNIIATIHLYYGEPLEDEAKEMIAWLEKQGEHAKFRDSIQVGDKVTRNEDGVLVNLSQLKRVAKPADKQGEQKPAWSKEDDNIIEWLIGYLEYQIMNATITEEKNNCLNAISILKSLKDKYTWKPSDRQIQSLEFIAEYHAFADQDRRKDVVALLSDLKKLKE